MRDVTDNKRKERRPGDGMDAAAFDNLVNVASNACSLHGTPPNSLGKVLHTTLPTHTGSSSGDNVHSDFISSDASSPSCHPVERTTCHPIERDPSSEKIEQMEARLRQIEEHNNQLIEEKIKLSHQLGIQTQVNCELKKLLVASIGEDMQTKFEHLVLDRTQTVLELSHLHSTALEDREEVEQAHIHADVWRSKFLATRVMSEELSRWKTALYYKYKESHTALQALLEEHSKIRALTHATQRCLVRIAEHLQCRDASLNFSETHTTMDAAFINQDIANSLVEVLDIRIKRGEINFNQSVSQTVVTTMSGRQGDILREIGGDARKQQRNDFVVEAHELSQAEELAQEVILNTCIQTDELTRMRKDYLAHNRISHFLNTNYHPTINCCEKCRGKTTKLL